MKTKNTFTEYLMIFLIITGCITIIEALQLCLIEIMVFGLNYWSGTIFSVGLNVTLAIGIALIYVLVTAIMWRNDKKSAREFNEKLKAFQEEMEKTCRS